MLVAGVQAPGVTAAQMCTLGIGSQLSLTVGCLNTGVWPHSMVCGPPTPEITGLVVSVTVMVWLAVLVLPQASLAVPVRVMALAFGQAPGAVASAELSVGLESEVAVTVAGLDAVVRPKAVP